MTAETAANRCTASDRELRVWATPLSEEAVKEAEEMPVRQRPSLGTLAIFVTMAEAEYQRRRRLRRAFP